MRRGGAQVSGTRYDIDDLGAAVAAAGRPRGRLPLAERVVEERR